MTQTWTAPAILEDHAKRIDTMERTIAGRVAPQAAKASSGILPPGTKVGGVPLDGDVGKPDNLRITTGALYDIVYADVEWDAPTIGHPALYEIVVSKDIDPGPGWISDYWRTFTSQGTRFRISDLVPGETYHVVVYSVGVLGVRSDPSLDNPASYFVAASDHTIPATATGFNLYSGLRNLIATWNENAEQDVAHGAGQYEVQISTTADFALNTSYRTTGLIITIPDTVAGTIYYGRVRAVDTSGNEGPWSLSDFVTAGKAITEEIGPGVIVSDHIVTAGLDAAVIKFGQMTGDRIQANTLDADAIKTSTLTAGDITLLGGSLRAGSPPVSGVLFNEHGIKAYKLSNVTFSVDENGDAVFNDVTVTGVFQTAASGARVRIQQTSGNPYIYFYSGLGSEHAPGNIHTIVDGSFSGMAIKTPYSGFATSDDVAEIDLISDGNFTSPYRCMIQAFGDYFSFTPRSKFSGSGTGVFMANIDAYYFRFNAGELNIFNTYTPTQYSDYAPLQIGNPGGGNTIQIGGNNIQTTYGGNERNLNLNQYSVGPASGVTLGNHAYAGRWAYGFDLTAQFCHKNFAGSPTYYGMRQTDTGAMAFGGSSYAFYNLLSSAGAGNFVGITGLGVIYQYTSSRKAKTEILDLADEPRMPSEAVLQKLDVKTYLAKDEDTGQRYYGLIAEEVAEIAPDLALFDENGEAKNVSWMQIWPLMIAEIQNLRREVNTLKGNPHGRTAIA